MTNTHLSLSVSGMLPHTNLFRFSFVSESAHCGVVLYDRASGREIARLPFTEGERYGSLYCKEIDISLLPPFSYQFYEEDRLLPDPHAFAYLGSSTYGRRRAEADLRALPVVNAFDWEQDARPKLPYEEVVAYCMHVRGFTMHPSSKVSRRGTFLGIEEKLPYLQELGVTTIELQPAYEFMEVPLKRGPLAREAGALESQKMTENKQEKPTEPGYEHLNYWGYTKGYYYAPKSAYAASEDSVGEFSHLVRTLHAHGMELVMQFYFPEGMRSTQVLDILRFWAITYHIDGFHLMGAVSNVTELAADPILSDRKLWYYSFDGAALYGAKQPLQANLAEYNDDYLYAMRRFLKGDDNMLQAVTYQMRHIPSCLGRIHYFSNYYGFTMMDMVSYDHKHNEDNGEGNRDGNDYNCSWNCGEEGPTRRKRIMVLRRKQYRNAIVLLMMTQSTPLFFMGDEFGNSQKGNNNPYCQDNRISWLNWQDADKNADLLAFFRQMISFRKEHGILHPQAELRLMDSLSCGYPDLSYHGSNAWRAQTESYNRHIGMMFDERYAGEGTDEPSFLYLAINMHWESHELALPRLPKGFRWERCLTTQENGSAEDALLAEADNESLCRVAERSISIYRSVPSGTKKINKNRNERQ